jgi:hypothetical protein
MNTIILEDESKFKYTTYQSRRKSCCNVNLTSIIPYQHLLMLNSSNGIKRTGANYGFYANYVH